MSIYNFFPGNINQFITFDIITLYIAHHITNLQRYILFEWLTKSVVPLIMLNSPIIPRRPLLYIATIYFKELQDLP